jgi:hypothetical protein
MNEVGVVQSQVEVEGWTVMFCILQCIDGKKNYIRQKKYKHIWSGALL